MSCGRMASWFRFGRLESMLGHRKRNTNAIADRDSKSYSLSNGFSKPDGFANGLTNSGSANSERDVSDWSVLGKHREWRGGLPKHSPERKSDEYLPGGNGDCRSNWCKCSLPTNYDDPDDGRFMFGRNVLG